MRTLEELYADVRQAMSVNDAEVLLRLSEELDTHATPEAIAVANVSRGVALRLRGMYQESLEHLHRAMALYQELDNRSSMASVAGNIGIVYAEMGDYTQALESYNQALDTYIELDDRYRIALLSSNIGNLYRNTGNYPLALEQFHRSLSMHEELGNRTGIANVIGNLGNVHRATGNYPEALEHYHRALSLHEELGNRNGAAIVISSIGNIHASTGNYAQALENYHHALSLHEELDDSASVAHVLGHIGSMHAATENYTTAFEFFRRSRALHEEHGDRASYARVTVSLMDALIATGQQTEAEALLHETQTLQIDDPHTLISRELCRAAIQDLHGQLDHAVETLQRALVQAGQHTIPERQAEVHKRLRDLSRKRNDFPGYIEHNNEFTRITEEINGKDTATKLAMQDKQREIDAREREHAKHMAVLHSTLPKHVAERVARGEEVNDSFDNAAVLFLDVVGFTTHTSTLDAGVVVDLLQNIFTTFDTICAEADVMKIKTIGDSYMAVAFPSDAHVVSLATVACAMQAQEFEWPVSGEPVKFRIGLHVGPVVAGVLGTERLQYDVWGDTVNVASRMESSGEAGRIHVSEAFALNLKSNQESRIKNPISETHDVSHASVARPSVARPSVARPSVAQSELVTRHSSLVTISSSLVTYSRGFVDIKGKGPMQTYWLESTST